MSFRHYDRPWRFFLLATLVPWAFWSLAAWLSHHLEGTTALALETGFGLAGLLAPAVIAWRMIVARPDLRADIISRLWQWSPGSGLYVALSLVLMPASILLAQAVSLAFGYSSTQFAWAKGISFSGGILPGWFFLVVAPLVEEMAWHSYGTDALRARMPLFWASILFAVYWALWHMPLALIRGYYHANVADQGALHSANFLVSLIPFVVLMNWLYYKTGRSILVAALFHLMAGCANEAFQTHPDSKVIQTGLLTLLCCVVVLHRPRFFFAR